MAITERKRKTDGVTVYVVDFRDRDGRRVRETAGTTRTQARKLLERRIGEVRAGTYVNPKAAKQAAEVAAGPTFAEFAERFLSDYAGRCRSDHYRVMLSPTGAIMSHFGSLRMRQITEAEFDAFRRDREAGGTSASTIRKNLTALGTLFKIAKRWKVIDVNPASDLQKPRESQPKIRFLSPAEWAVLRETAPPWLRPMLTLAVSTGMRLGELAKLRWDDIDRRSGLINVTSDNKTSSSRAVPINRTAGEVLDGLVRHLRTPWVFVDVAGASYASREARNRISKQAKAAMKAAGLVDATFHTLRHTAASWMVQAGSPLAEVKEILGHTSMQTTLRYAHLRPEHLVDSIAAVDAAMRELDTPVDTPTQSREQQSRQSSQLAVNAPLIRTRP